MRLWDYGDDLRPCVVYMLKVKLDISIGGQDERLEVVVFGASWTLRVLVFTFFHYNHYITFATIFLEIRYPYSPDRLLDNPLYS